MSKIKHYRLADGFTVDGFRDEYGIRNGGTWACSDSESYIFKTIFFRNEIGHEFEFSVYVCFPSEERMDGWNDLDYILVLDEDFCQPYGPFYDRFEEEVDKGEYWCLAELIDRYNSWMDSLSFLKEVK